MNYSPNSNICKLNKSHNKSFEKNLFSECTYNAILFH